MPWHLESDNPGCSGWAVVKDSDGKVVGCHPTKAKAQAQLAALNINVKEQPMAPEQQTRTRTAEFEVVRAAEEGDGLTLEGYAAVFNNPTEINNAFEGRFTEIIAPGAFKRTIGQKGPGGIKMQFDHGQHPMVGSLPLGTIQELSEDSRGLFVRARLLSNWMVEPIRDAIAEGAIDGMSFRFRVLREDVDKETDPPTRTVREVELFELGPVVYPAYAETSVGVRSDDAEPEPEPDRALPDTPDEPVDGPSPEPAADTSPEPAPEEPRTEEPPKEVAVVDIDRFTTLDALKARLAEVVVEQNRMSSEYGVRDFEPADQAIWDDLREEREALDKRIKVVEERLAYLADSKPPQVEPTTRPVGRGVPPSRIPENIYDLSAYRSASNGPDDELRLLRDGAMRSVEAAKFPHPNVRREDAQEHIQKLLDEVDYADFESGKVGGEIARRILVTGNPLYQRAFTKHLAGRAMSPEEQRAFTLGSSSAGQAVVYTLDPTVVPTSNFSVNPWRALARQETIAGTNEWKALTSGAITAAYSAEATETTDNTPTLAQPDIIVEKAQALVLYSIESGQDWGMLQTEMARLLQDSKDDLEATKFAVGAGHASNEPKGVITGATNTVGTTTTAAFVVADLYKVFEALPPRFRARAQFAANLFTIDKIRQFGTADALIWTGFGNLQQRIDAGNAGASSPSTAVPLFGRTVYEATAMDGALTTTSKILVVGDFGRYFCIVDRVGLDIEIVPTIFGTAHRPTGQRGLYAYWRNSSDVLSAAAFRVLVT